MMNVIIKQAELMKQLFQIEDVELLNKIALSIEQTIEAYELSKKENLLNELYGVWSDMDDDLEKEIMNGRIISKKVIDLD